MSGVRYDGIEKRFEAFTALHADCDLSVERVGEIGDDDADRRAGSGFEGPRNRIGVIAGLGNGALDPEARLLRNHGGAADDVRNRGFRNASPLGNVHERGHAASAICASARERPAAERLVPSSPS